MSRDKGKVGERELAAVLREHGFSEARRGAQNRGGPDSPDVVGVPGVHFECKRTEQLRLYDALTQATNDCGVNLPVVAHRKNKQEWVAVLRLSDFLDLIKRCQP